MTLIQPILIGLCLLAFVLYLKLFRSRLVDRLIASSLFLGALICVAVPDLAQMLADKVGVTRGSDLFFYLFSLAVVMVLITMLSKLGQLEQRQVELVREFSILSSKLSTLGKDVSENSNSTLDQLK